MPEEVNTEDVPAKVLSAVRQKDPSGTITRVVACWIKDVHYGKSLTWYEVTLRSPSGSRTYRVLRSGNGYLCESIDPQKSPGGDVQKAAPQE